MQIIIFLGQDNQFYLSTKSCLQHRYHPFLKADAILCEQSDMEQADIDLLSLFSVLKLPLFKFLKLCNPWKAPNRAHYFQKEFTTWTKRQNSFMTWLLD